jgi:hypothetical protein
VRGRVVEQVRDQLLESRRIAVHGQVRRCRPDLVRHRVRSDRRLGDGAFEQLGHPDRLDVQGRHAGVDAGEVKEVLDQPAEPLGLVERRLQSGRIRLGDAVDEVLEDCTQRGQRRSQLVRDVGDQLASLAIDGGEVLGHPVERPSQLTHLVAGGGVHPSGVVAPCHLASHLSHLPQGRGHTGGQQLGDGQGDQDGDRDAQPRLDSTTGADGGEHRCDRHACSDQEPELELDRRDPVQRTLRGRHAVSSAYPTPWTVRTRSAPILLRNALT